MVEDAENLLKDSIENKIRSIIEAYVKCCEEDPIFSAITGLEKSFSNGISITYENPLDEKRINGFTIAIFSYDTEYHLLTIGKDQLFIRSSRHDLAVNIKYCYDKLK